MRHSVHGTCIHNNRPRIHTVTFLPPCLPVSMIHYFELLYSRAPDAVGSQMHLGLPSYPIMSLLPRDPATSTDLRPMTTKRINLRRLRGGWNSSDPDKAIEARLGCGRTLERLSSCTRSSVQILIGCRYSCKANRRSYRPRVL